MKKTAAALGLLALAWLPTGRSEEPREPPAWFSSYPPPTPGGENGPPEPPLRYPLFPSGEALPNSQKESSSASADEDLPKPRKGPGGKSSNGDPPKSRKESGGKPSGEDLPKPRKVTEGKSASSVPPTQAVPPRFSPSPEHYPAHLLPPPAPAIVDPRSGAWEQHRPLHPGGPASGVPGGARGIGTDHAAVGWPIAREQVAGSRAEGRRTNYVFVLPQDHQPGAGPPNRIPSGSPALPASAPRTPPTLCGLVLQVMHLSPRSTSGFDWQHPLRLPGFRRSRGEAGGQAPQRTPDRQPPESRYCGGHF
jgi:hypothetical protein